MQLLNIIATLNEWDTQALIWVNGHYNSFADWIMWCLSQHWCIALVVAATYLFVVFKGERHQWWLLLLGVGLCFLLADQISSSIIKESVQRPRPCHVLDNLHMFRTHCGGSFSFVSSHAANCWTVAIFLGLLAKKKIHISWLMALLIVWATLVCYSRPYLGKHYPGDVICGAMLGILLGMLVYWIYCKVLNAIEHKKERQQVE